MWVLLLLLLYYYYTTRKRVSMHVGARVRRWCDPLGVVVVSPLHQAVGVADHGLAVAHGVDDLDLRLLCPRPACLGWRVGSRGHGAGSRHGSVTAPALS